MTKTTQQITPGMTINVSGTIYRVESCVKMSVPRGAPFIKTKLRNLMTDEVSEKNFKADQIIKEVSLIEHQLEYLYPEGTGYLFLDIITLEKQMVPGKILGDAVQFLKEGVQLKAFFYDETIFSVELPPFLELMVVKIEGEDNHMKVSHATKIAILETGAKVEVPAFIEVGDVVKVDVHAKAYIQRV